MTVENDDLAVLLKAIITGWDSEDFPKFDKAIQRARRRLADTEPNLDVFVNLLRGFMFAYWEQALEKSDDGSYRETIAEAHRELVRCGVAVVDQQQFEIELEAKLRGGVDEAARRQ